MPYVENENERRLLRKVVIPKEYGDKLMKLGNFRYVEYQNVGKLSAWTFHHNMSFGFNSQLIIILTRNMFRILG